MDAPPDGQDPPPPTTPPVPAVPLVPPVTDPEVLEAAARAGEPVPWRGWDAAGIALVYLLAAFPLYLLLPGGVDAEAPPVPLLDTAVLLLATLGWLALVRGPHAVRRAFGPRRHVPPMVPSLLLGAGVGLAWPVLDTLLYALLEATGAPMPPVQEHLADWIAVPATRALVVADIALLTPVVEELLFRAVLFGGLARRWGVRIAAVASSLVFGLAHIESGGLDSVFMVGSTFLFGLACVWLLHRRRTLLAPITAHIVTNVIGTVALLTA